MLRCNLTYQKLTEQEGKNDPELLKWSEKNI